MSDSSIKPGGNVYRDPADADQYRTQMTHDPLGMPKGVGRNAKTAQSRNLLATYPPLDTLVQRTGELATDSRKG